MRLEPSWINLSRARGAYTLIELLVVIAIITVIMGIGMGFMPTLTQDNRITTATDRITGALLIAKQRAKRDARLTGVRLFSANNSNQITELVYIQEPDDFTGGTLHHIEGVTGVGNVAYFGLNNPDFTGGGVSGLGQVNLAPVQAGDYLEVRRSGSVTQIQQVMPPGQRAATTGDPTPYNRLLLQSALPNNGPTNLYRIIRSARPMLGEEPVVLPTGIIINLAQTATSGSINVPTRTVTDAMGGSIAFRDILFSPAGNLVRTGNTGGIVCLWVQDTNTGTTMRPLLVTIQARNGFIATHPVSTVGDPYQYARDGRSSGM